jgi:hypothetical protein
MVSWRQIVFMRLAIRYFSWSLERIGFYFDVVSVQFLGFRGRLVSVPSSGFTR